MERIEIPSQEIELVFENCECIKVDYWAIKFLHFETESELYTFEQRGKNLMKSTKINNFKLSLDLSNPKHFHHTARLVETDSYLEDGKQCITRLIHSNDLTTIYINNVCYIVPWENKKIDTDIGIPLNTNTLQKNDLNEDCLKISVSK
jgi:hypothetical protein